MTHRVEMHVVCEGGAALSGAFMLMRSQGRRHARRRIEHLVEANRLDLQQPGVPNR